MKSVLKYIGMKDINLNDYGFNNHLVYCEPFSGSFNTGFRLYEKGYAGNLIYNDIDKRVVNFWECLSDDYSELHARCNQLNNILKNTILSVEKEKILDSWSKSNDKFKRAASEFIIRTYLTLDGVKWNFKDDIESIFDFYLSFDALHSIEINNTDYKNIINKYDSKDTFFMIDPPYDISKVNTYYRGNYKKFNHEELADTVKSIKGSWLLTYNDNEHIRGLYKEYKIKEVTRNLFGKQYTELYITN